MSGPESRPAGRRSWSGRVVARAGIGLMLMFDALAGKDSLVFGVSHNDQL
jgi:hypothetical protein